jgi:hypothetical protein
MKMRKKPISKEDLIQKIEARLQEPDLPLREFTSLTKRLANLRGWVEQGRYVRVSPSQALNTQQEEPESLPSWWSDSWARIFISERACGIFGGWGRWGRKLDQFEAEWAKQSGFSSVEEFREALRREDAEYRAQQPLR